MKKTRLLTLTVALIACLCALSNARAEGGYAFPQFGIFPSSDGTNFWMDGWLGIGINPPTVPLHVSGTNASGDSAVFTGKVGITGAVTIAGAATVGGTVTVATDESDAVVISGDSATDATIPFDVQATNDPGNVDYLARLGDSADSDLFSFRGNGNFYADLDGIFGDDVRAFDKVHFGNLSGQLDKDELQILSANGRFYNSNPAGNLSIASHEMLNIGLYTGYTNSSVRIYDETGLNTTFSNGAVTLAGSATVGGDIQQTSTTNIFKTVWYTASNRWAHVEIYGAAAPYTTNIYFLTDTR